MKKDSNWPPVATTRLELDPGRLGFGPLHSSQGLAGKCQRSIWSAEVGDHRKTAEVLTWKIVSCQEIDGDSETPKKWPQKTSSFGCKLLLEETWIPHDCSWCPSLIYFLFPIVSNQEKGLVQILPSSNSANRLKFLGLLEFYRNETGTGSSVRYLHDFDNQIYRNPNKHDFSWMGLKVQAHVANSIGNNMKQLAMSCVKTTFLEC